MSTHTLYFNNYESAIPFDMPDNPREAAELIAYLLDEYSGNSLGYPSIVSSEEEESKDDK